MNDEEQRTNIAKMLLQFEDEKQRFAGLKNVANGIAEDFEQLAKMLKEAPEVAYLKIPAEMTSLLAYKRLGALLEDLKKTNHELGRLGGLLREAGRNV